MYKLLQGKYLEYNNTHISFMVIFKAARDDNETSKDSERRS